MRRYIRHPTDIPIDIKVVAVNSKRDSNCPMTTVSCGGLSCHVADEIAVGCQVSISIPSLNPPYDSSGEVVWCHKKGDHFEIGVSFNNDLEAFQSRMVQQVCQIEHYKNKVFEQEGRVLDGNQAAAEWIAKYAAKFTQ